eukprot:SAG25_NODE_1058_length_4155_cov_2.109221_4_plen_90_part_00
MGLGKTIQTIALLLSGVYQPAEPQAQGGRGGGGGGTARKPRKQQQEAKAMAVRRCGPIASRQIESCYYGCSTVRVLVWANTRSYSWESY